MKYQILFLPALILLLCLTSPMLAQEQDVEETAKNKALLEKEFMASYTSLLLGDKVEYLLTSEDTEAQLKLSVVEVKEKSVRIRVTTSYIDHEGEDPQMISSTVFKVVEFALLNEDLPNEDSIHTIMKEFITLTVATDPDANPDATAIEPDSEEPLPCLRVDIVDKEKTRFWYSPSVPFGLVRVQQNGKTILDLKSFHFEPRKKDSNPNDE